jgi:GAF domain-containing protein
MSSKFDEIAEFGKQLMNIESVEQTLELIAKEAKELVDAKRCSIFIVDNQKQILWSRLSDGVGRIVIGIDSGVVGETYKTKKPQLVNRPYEDERFLKNIDKQSGFETKNIITVPIFNSKQEVMGVIELLNKKRFDFTTEDLELLTFFANFVSGSLELALLKAQ